MYNTHSHIAASYRSSMVVARQVKEPYSPHFWRMWQKRRMKTWKSIWELLKIMTTFLSQAPLPGLLIEITLFKWMLAELVVDWVGCVTQRPTKFQLRLCVIESQQLKITKDDSPRRLPQPNSSPKTSSTIKQARVVWLCSSRQPLVTCSAIFSYTQGTLIKWCLAERAYLI